MVAPFVSPATAAKIAVLRRRGFATRERLADPTVLLLLFRTQSDGSVVQVGPREVVMTTANRLPENRNAPATAATVTSGTVEAEWPFDVESGDRFVLPDGSGFVIRDVEPVQNGTVTALWEREGGSP